MNENVPIGSHVHVVYRKEMEDPRFNDAEAAHSERTWTVLRYGFNGEIYGKLDGPLPVFPGIESWTPTDGVYRLNHRLPAAKAFEPCLPLSSAAD